MPKFPYPYIHVELTEEEKEAESRCLGVHLPRRYRARYQAIHAQKVLERRALLEAEDWEKSDYILTTKKTFVF